MGEYLVNGNIIVPTNVTLTIDPGAIVKFGLGLNLTVNAGGTLVANGTIPQPIVFTSINDQSVGANTNGVTTTPRPAIGIPSISRAAMPTSTMFPLATGQDRIRSTAA